MASYDSCHNSVLYSLYAASSIEIAEPGNMHWSDEAEGAAELDGRIPSWCQMLHNPSPMRTTFALTGVPAQDIKTRHNKTRMLTLTE